MPYDTEVDRVFREFRKYAGDGYGGTGALPIGDPTTGPNNPRFAEIRALLHQIIGAVESAIDASPRFDFLHILGDGVQTQWTLPEIPVGGSVLVFTGVAHVPITDYAIAGTVITITPDGAPIPDGVGGFIWFSYSSGAGAGSALPSSSISMRQLGATGDMAEDASDALEAAFAMDGDVVVYGEPGAVYKITRTLLCQGKSFVFRGNGCTFARAASLGNADIMHFVGAWGAVQAVTNIAFADNVTTLTVTGSAAFAEKGTIVRICSEEDLPQFPLDGAKKGEWAGVSAAPTPTTISIPGKLRYAYDTGSNCQIAILNREYLLIVEDCDFCDETPAGDNTDTRIIKVEGYVAPEFRNIRFGPIRNRGLGFYDCFEPSCIGIHAYGYGAWSDNQTGTAMGFIGCGRALVRDCIGTNLRHLTVFNHGAVALDERLMAGGPNGYGDSGGQVIGCDGLNCNYPPFDTHGGARNVSYTACRAISCQSRGWSIRGVDITLDGCSDENCFAAWNIFTESDKVGAQTDNIVIKGHVSRNQRDFNAINGEVDEVTIDGHEVLIRGGDYAGLAGSLQSTLSWIYRCDDDATMISLRMKDVTIRCKQVDFTSLLGVIRATGNALDVDGMQIDLNTTATTPLGMDTPVVIQTTGSGVVRVNQVKMRTAGGDKFGAFWAGTGYDVDSRLHDLVIRGCTDLHATDGINTLYANGVITGPVSFGNCTLMPVLALGGDKSTAAAKATIWCDGSTLGIASEVIGGSVSARKHIAFRNSNGEVGSLITTGAGTALATSSDRRLKQDMVEIEDALERVMDIPAYRHRWRSDPKGPLIDGLMADDVQEVAPYAVIGEPNGKEMQQLDKAALVPLLWAAVRKLAILVREGR